MKIYNKLYTKRELWRRPQEDMVTRLSMSTDGYAKLEYGETRLNISRLEQIASVFNVDLKELMAINERSIICLISEKSQHGKNDYATSQQALTAEKTVIMIAHRLKTVERADQIIVVDRGKIVQQGTHTQLMEQDGIYRNFIGERREAASWKVHK